MGAYLVVGAHLVGTTTQTGFSPSGERYTGRKQKQKLIDHFVKLLPIGRYLLLANPLEPLRYHQNLFLYCMEGSYIPKM